MAIEFRLTLAGELPLDQVAELAAVEVTETQTTSGRRMLSASLNERCGYVIDFVSGEHGYYDAEDDDGSLWTWEPKSYVDVDFYMRKEVLAEKGIPNMLATAARILNGSTEDAALVFNGNHLLLTRTDGTLRKHRQSWWEHHQLDKDAISR
ncbi:SitI3 family protein [Micromonospora echinofusca]|uniref:Immunity protein 63 n=1 Tax=Micromonospora echinofusca TaxID=47858 RepID=A0ABS3W1B6_MICEH|nr:SitI3 family protein [Micromonospora echinofusca]MBO4210393.1 hypothetical protein [Micromonospora echinofusca]